MVKAKTVGEAGLQGWRNKVADTVASPIAKRSTVSEHQVRSFIGGLFLILTVLYLVRALQQIAAQR